jgi:hypothetical protein
MERIYSNSKAIEDSLPFRWIPQRYWEHGVSLCHWPGVQKVYNIPDCLLGSELLFKNLADL